MSNHRPNHSVNVSEQATLNLQYCTVVYVTTSYSSNKEDARGDITTMKTITDYTRYWYG